MRGYCTLQRLIEQRTVITDFGSMLVSCGVSGYDLCGIYYPFQTPPTVTGQITTYPRPGR
jgi:hypothetical protein